MLLPQALRTAPLAAETTWSFLRRTACSYGMDERALLAGWEQVNAPPRGQQRLDGEVLLNRAGQRLLAELSQTAGDVLARALPSWLLGPEAFGPAADAQPPRARWQAGSATPGLAPVAFGCRLCTAARTGRPVQVMRYQPRWQRVCVRHGRWLLDAGDAHRLEHLDVRSSPEIVRAQQRWPRVARRAAVLGYDPVRVFALAQAMVARWWQQALGWEQERIWPARLHRLAGGDAGPRFWQWHAVARDAATFPEIVAVAEILVDPAAQERVWADSGRERPRPMGPGGSFVTLLGERVGRPWLGPLIGVDYSSALYDFMGVIVRLRRRPPPPGASGWAAYGYDPFFLRREHRPPSVSLRLRQLAELSEGARQLAARQEAARTARWGPGLSRGEAFTTRRGCRGRAYYRRPVPAAVTREGDGAQVRTDTGDGAAPS